MSVPVSTTLTFPPTRPASLWDAFGDRPERHWPGYAGTHCSWQDSTSSWGAPSTNCLPQAHLGLGCPFQQHYSREMLSISTLVFRPFTGKNDSRITQTPHGFSQPNATPIPWLPRYFQVKEMLKTEDLKPVVRWDLNLSRALQSLVKN